MKAYADYPEVMTEAEAAEFLRVAPKTLQDWRTRGYRKTGLGPRYSKAGGIKYLKASLLEWLKAQERTSTTEAQR